MSYFKSLAKLFFCNIMTLHDQPRDTSNPIGIISYFPKVDFSLVICYLTYLTFLVNLLNQPFKSIYVIKFFNQFIIELVMLIAYGILFPQIYKCRKVHSYLLS